VSVVARLVAASLAVGAALAVLTGAASPGAGAVLTVRVDARDFAFALSRRSVPAGTTVRFVVRNRGGTVHDFVVKRQRTRILKPGQRQTITVAFPRTGTFRFLCSVPGHARLGMRGTFRVGTGQVSAPPPPPTAPPVTVGDTVELTKIGTFAQPVLVTAPDGDPRLFVVEQIGRVRIVRDGVVDPQPFLDLRAQVTARGESGLLSIAFSPEYARDGRVYAYYNARQGAYGDIRVSAFERRPDDPDSVAISSERVLLTIQKPYENHNGGMLQFDASGYLYASVGDGDPGVLHPAGFYAQRLDSLLGSILRIDPRAGDPYEIPPDNPFRAKPAARPEIWAYGLRNPWRFWIDSASREMLIADVGSTSREELDVAPLDEPGLNFGWPCFEGSLVFDDTQACDSPVAPVLDIPHDDGVCAIIGGVVLHDERLPAHAGRYLLGDLCTGEITSVVLENGRVEATEPLGLSVPGLTSFGVDGAARVYATSSAGSVFRLDPRAR
jgi:hypothetical protein